MQKNLLWAVVFGLLLQNVLSFPRGSNSDSQSDEDDTQQQQQQNINTESLEEFTKSIKTKGKPKVTEKLVEEKTEDEPCFDLKKIGQCKAAVPRFYFNKDEGKCETFIFGGCGANRNNFKQLSDCETTCAKHLTKATSLPYSGQEICDQPPVLPEAGANRNDCKALMPRWTYNAGEGKCIQFIYNGCGGTKNIFTNQIQCKSACGSYKKQKDDSDSSSDELVPSQTTMIPTPTLAVMPQQPSLGNENPICSLPMNKGFCYALKYKYFFNKEHNRCEKFEYGGCGGNQNKFNTAEECIRACGGDAPAEDPECSNIDCPWGLYSHYTTLDCKPIYDGQSCCPTRYECPDKVQSNNTIEGGRSLTAPTEDAQPRCYYKGKSYAIGENVPEASDAGSCRAACICTQGPVQGAKITCAAIECPEHLGAIPEGKVGCLPVYKRGSCCSYDFFCPNDTLTLIETQQPATEVPEPHFKCNLDGNSYFEGQRMYPKKSPCLKCICQKGFNGSLTDEFCEPIDCGIEIYYSDYLAKGCAPVYFQSEDGTSSCCPISWECPNDRTEQPPPSPPTGASLVTPGTAPPLVVPTPSVVEIGPSTPTPNVTQINRIVRSKDACQLPKVVGMCKARRIRHFFNTESNKCEEFIYSGCGSNDNNFVSIQDCQRLCETVENDSGTTTTEGNRVLSRSLDSNKPQPRSIYVTEVDPCTMPKRQGNCKGFFPRWYYSPEENLCQLFIFGGCRGNRNNFYSKDSCEATCTNAIPVDNLRTSVPVESEGDASMVKFGEDAPSSKSATIDVDPCSLPKEIGKCRAFVRRFYYDSETKQCQYFGYGGCGGNQNNFMRIQDCERRCIVEDKGESLSRRRSGIQVQPTTDADNSGSMEPPKEPLGFQPPSFGFLERCRLPLKAGSCLGIVPSYYYDAETNTCNFFLYSGCFGNANRFSTLQECENRCKKPSEVANSNTNSEGIGGRVGTWRRPIPRTEERSAGTETSQIGQDSDKGMCKLAPEAGPCKAFALRYHWDAVSQQCLPFVFSGCEGNKNNFLSESDCLSACGSQPTIEQLTSEGVLSCTFGNETLPLGATAGGEVGRSNRYSSSSPDPIPCGVPVCQCITPPSVTCIQVSCPTPPPTTTTEKICPTPTCGSNCTPSMGLDGCPTCDCNENESQVQVQEVFVKSVKG